MAKKKPQKTPPPAPTRTRLPTLKDLFPNISFAPSKPTTKRKPPTDVESFCSAVRMHAAAVESLASSIGSLAMSLDGLATEIRYFQ